MRSPRTERSTRSRVCEEKLELFTRLLREQPVTWSGTVCSPLTEQLLTPPLPAAHIPTWVGVGGSPESVIRAARHGLPLMIAIIGGHASRFAPFVDLYKRALDEFGTGPQPIGVHSPGFVAATDQEAMEIQWPHWYQLFDTVSRERGWPQPSREQFESEVEHGSLYVGSPDTAAAKIASTIETLQLSRFDLFYALGAVPHEQKLETIELYGREVVPRVRQLLSERQRASTAA